MAVLILENVPAEVMERLEQLAASKGSSLPDEALALLQLGLHLRESPRPRLADFVPGGMISPPYDLPRTSIPVSVHAVPAKKPRLPDPPFLGELAPE